MTYRPDTVLMVKEFVRSCRRALVTEDHGGTYVSVRLERHALLMEAGYGRWAPRPVLVSRDRIVRVEPMV